MSQFRLSKSGLKSLTDISPQSMVVGESQPFISGTENVISDKNVPEKYSRVRFCLGLGAIICGFITIHVLAQLILALILY